MRIRIVFIVTAFFLNIFNANSQTHYYIIPSQTFELKNRRNDWDIYLNKVELISNNKLEVSHLIKLKEYKEFLKNAKNTYHDTIYARLIPDSSLFKKSTFARYIDGTEFDNYPVVGVTWEGVDLFCRWKTVSENKGDSIQYIYRLPTRKEWLASKHFVDKMGVPNDFSLYFSDWVFDYYDESVYSFSNVVKPDQVYLSKKSYMPALRRKKILGKSYLFQNESMNTTGFYQYSDKSTSCTSFRCVKASVVLPPKYKKDFLSNKWKYFSHEPDFYLLKKWELLGKLVFDNAIGEYDNNNGIVAQYHQGKNAQLIKFVGAYSNGELVGDCYYFNKKGQFSKQGYYADGKFSKTEFFTELEQKTSLNKNKITSNFYEFIDSIKSFENDNNVITTNNITYQTQNGRMDGYFIYSNGNVNVAGRYTDNMKTGIWAMWNCKEELIMQRNYTNAYNSEKAYSIAPQNKLTELLKTPFNSMHINNNGYFDYFELQERDVVWSETIWRTLLPENNPLLFQNDLFSNLLKKYLENGKIVAYKTSSNYYKQLVDTISLDELNEIFLAEDIEIIEYNIKEVYAFDRERQNLEIKVIIISPVVMDKNSGKKKELFEVYIPETRKYFAMEKLSGKKLPPHIKTMDDVFFFRYFGGMINAESNFYNNRKISSYKTGNAILLEAERIEYKLKCVEFDLWNFFSVGD